MSRVGHIYPIDYYDNDLNIIGIYKLKIKRDVKEAPWSNFKFATPVPIVTAPAPIIPSQCPTTFDRDIGFSLLSNRENVTRYLKKTKFCQIMIDKGECHREVCNFAHSVNEIVFPDCAFKENCKKQDRCLFKHPHETIEEYKSRIHFTVPRFII
jgi:hypothetical protein